MLQYVLSNTTFLYDIWEWWAQYKQLMIIRLSPSQAVYSVCFSSYHLGERKGLATTGFEPASPWQDSNLQSRAIGWYVTITSHGALPVSYAAVNSLQSFGFTRGEVCFLSWEAGYNIWSASESHSDGVIHILINLKITFLHALKLLDFGTVLVFALRGVQ